MVGDQILRFGSVHASNYEGLQSIMGVIKMSSERVSSNAGCYFARLGMRLINKPFLRIAVCHAHVCPANARRPTVHSQSDPHQATAGQQFRVYFMFVSLLHSW